MCLTVKKNKLASFCRIFNFTMKKTAKKDIIVYKALCTRNYNIKNITNEEKIQLHNSEFKGIIKGIECNGKIVICQNYIYFCTNDPRLNGAGQDKLGYDYSWIMDNDVQEIIVNDKKLILTFDLVTPYQNTIVEVGETYKSELTFNNYEDTISVEKGLHSYEKINSCKNIGSVVVKCKIPKGSKYYVGTFGDDKSYASNTLEYLEII